MKELSDCKVRCRWILTSCPTILLVRLSNLSDYRIELSVRLGLFGVGHLNRERLTQGQWPVGVVVQNLQQAKIYAAPPCAAEFSQLSWRLAGWSPICGFRWGLHFYNMRNHFKYCGCNPSLLFMRGNCASTSPESPCLTFWHSPQSRRLGVGFPLRVFINLPLC